MSNNTMKGKRVVITGPTSGVGKEIALQLAGLGAEVILACRDLQKGAETAKEIASLPGAPEAVVLPIDTSSQASIRKFAVEFQKKYDRLDVLVNNAACNTGTLPRSTSIDGIELTFATNVVGYYLLVHELRDLLVKSAPARIVNVASTFASDLDLDDLQFERRPYESFKAYAQSKACDRLLTWALDRRVAGSRVTANAMTPGLITETGLYRNAPSELMSRLNQYAHGRTSAMGADTAVWLASDPDLEGVSGKFYEERKELPCEFRNEADEEKLWTICKGLTGEGG